MDKFDGLIEGDAVYRVEVYCTTMGWRPLIFEGRVSKVTDHGFWLVNRPDEIGGLKEGWRSFRTRYVAPSLREAWISCVKRCEAWAKHERRRLKRAQSAIAAARDLAPVDIVEVP